MTPSPIPNLELGYQLALVVSALPARPPEPSQNDRQIMPEGRLLPNREADYSPTLQQIADQLNAAGYTTAHGQDTGAPNPGRAM